jgi:putative hydrolase of the HAD superfamily
MGEREEKQPWPKIRWLLLWMLLVVAVMIAAPPVLSRWVDYDSKLDDNIIVFSALAALLYIVPIPLLKSLVQVIFRSGWRFFCRLRYRWRFLILAVFIVVSVPLASLSLFYWSGCLGFGTLAHRLHEIYAFRSGQRKKRNEAFRAERRAEKERIMRDEIAGGNIKTIIFDMYGVIIKESKGRFIPYTFDYFPKSEHERLTKLFGQDNLFTKAGNGEITSEEFLTELGFDDPVFYMQDYIENYLTIDEDFHRLAEQVKDKYSFALLSNDVSDWSKYICGYYKLEQYFPVKVVSADVGCRKPDAKIFEIALERLGVPAEECIFIDNSVENLRTASRLGMNTILFNRDDEEYEGKIVYSFDELLRILPY